MKFYKIVNPKGNRGITYHEGLNTDPLPFNPSGNCEGGGIYFAREDILAFLNYGTELYEVEPVGDEVYENPSSDVAPKKWKSHSVMLKHIGKLCDLDTIKVLVEQGANIHSNGDNALSWAASNGYLDIVKYLVEQGANIHARGDNALRWAASNGHLDIVKYLVENGSKAFCDEALCNSVYNDHLDIAEYLIEQGADIHAYNDEALRGAKRYGNTNISNFLIEKGAKIPESDNKNTSSLRLYLSPFFYMS